METRERGEQMVAVIYLDDRFIFPFQNTAESCYTTSHSLILGLSKIVNSFPLYNSPYYTSSFSFLQVNDNQ